ncbi:hypothetical protein ACFXPI_01300 [Streptomyces sp. NPDC059104]|uniref:hypothetical protein n=1 Tax=Streptomyces sp. NPDC059104 TaxID=3346729 RepID=UPI00368474DA
MNIDDLDWQARRYGGISPNLVSLLLEQGELELLIRAAAERGEWFCAEAAVRELCEVGAFERALAVLEPFVAIGWGPARWANAEVMRQAGRAEEALELVRPDEAGRQSQHVCRNFAELLVKAGRVDEAITLLTPHIDGWLMAVLVDLTEGQDRDERVLELIAPLAQRAANARAEGRWHDDAWEAQQLQAQVLERAGRPEEAIRVLGESIAAKRYLEHNTPTAYAELLARHGRIEELRELVDGDHTHVALPCYAHALESHGRADEAEAVLRKFIASTEHPERYYWPLIDLLARQGRIDEAVEVGRATFDGHDACLLDAVIRLLHDAGRFEDALALLDERTAEFVEEHADWVGSNRLCLLGEAGRLDEALAYAETLPVDQYRLAETTAWLLGEAGRADEAIDLLRAGGIETARGLAEFLIRQGRADEAIAALPSLAVLHEDSRRQDAALQAAGNPDDPWQ